MSNVREKLWIWGHEAGSHNTYKGLAKPSRMTPAEGAFYMGLPNLILVRYDGKPQPPFDQSAIAFRPLQQVVWSIVGAGGASEREEVQQVVALSKRFPNITGAMMDDFFRPSPKPAVYTPEELAGFRRQLHNAERPLDLWVVLYAHQLALPIREHLRQCDVVAFWTWTEAELVHLEENMDRAEKLKGSARVVLGCYLYDYGADKPMPVSSMQRQCELGLRWLKEGRIAGMIFLASCICDLELPAVEWTRRWIDHVGGEEL